MSRLRPAAWYAIVCAVYCAESWLPIVRLTQWQANSPRFYAADAALTVAPILATVCCVSACLESRRAVLAFAIAAALGSAAGAWIAGVGR